MTEDDTFLALKKLTWEEVWNRYHEFGRKPIVADDIEKFWAGTGWTHGEFHKRWAAMPWYSNLR